VNARQGGAGDEIKDVAEQGVAPRAKRAHDVQGEVPAKRVQDLQAQIAGIAASIKAYGDRIVELSLKQAEEPTEARAAAIVDLKAQQAKLEAQQAKLEAQLAEASGAARESLISQFRAHAAN